MCPHPWETVCALRLLDFDCIVRLRAFRGSAAVCWLTHKPHNSARERHTHVHLPLKQQSLGQRRKRRWPVFVHVRPVKWERCRGVPKAVRGNCACSQALTPRLVQPAGDNILSRSQVVWCVGERHGVTAGNVGWVMAKNSHSRREISVGVSDRRFVGSHLGDIHFNPRQPKEAIAGASQKKKKKTHDSSVSVPRQTSSLTWTLAASYLNNTNIGLTLNLNLAAWLPSNPTI
jgi:hypothetical protein